MAENEAEDTIRFNVSISTDRDRYFRRRCPLCGRDFKTQVDENDLAWAIAPHIRRVEQELGQACADDSMEMSGQRFHCPYCECCVEASETLPEETMSYLKREMMRELVLPRFNDMLFELSRIGNQSGGLISIRVEASGTMLPPRPISGPEAPDMKIVEFLCCGKKAKISEGWHAVRVCIFCGSPVTLV